MSTQSCSRSFEQDVLPHLHNAYNFARWLTGNDEDAEDIVQEAYLRAFRFYHRFQGGDARPWLLKIVRNTYYTWSQKNPAQRFIDFDEDLFTSDEGFTNPEQILIQESSEVLLRRALDALPTRSRAMLILRELEGMSYREISTVMDVPPGTVMSTLSRARARLRRSVIELAKARPEAERGDEMLSGSCFTPARRHPLLEPSS